MAFPKLDFLDSTLAKPAKPAKADPNISHSSHFSQRVGETSCFPPGNPSTNPPPDRPIRDDHAEWLLGLSKAERREWWRSVAEHLNRREDWAQAEAEAVAEFTNQNRAPSANAEGETE